jgi:predicted dehydrogenase
MRALVVGFGSIGRRHVRNLQSLGVSSIDIFDPHAPVSEQKVLRDEIALAHEYSLAFICSPNDRHLESFRLVAPRARYVFLEKPVSVAPQEAVEFTLLASTYDNRVMVGCNYRFEQGLTCLKSWLDENRPRVLFVDCEYGHYLPQWRERPYQESYSAHCDQGGGIAFDRIHEFDYLRWLLGDFEFTGGIVSRLSALEIDTEDLVDLNLKFRSGSPGRLHLDYLQRNYCCRLKIITDQGDLEWSFMPCFLRHHAGKGRSETLFEGPADVNEMYLAQAKYFLGCVREQQIPGNGIEEAFSLVRKIAEAKVRYER